MYEGIYEKIAESYNMNDYVGKYRSNCQLTTFEKDLILAFFVKMPTVYKSVLDIGCGDASLFGKHLVSIGCQYTGIDISRVQIARAKVNLPMEKFILGNFLDMYPNGIETFDGIVCMYALFNFIEEDQKLAIKKMYECLRPGGVALINIRKEISSGIKYNNNWCGKPMYWSLPGVMKTLLWCTEAGFYYRIYNNPDNEDYVFAILMKGV